MEGGAAPKQRYVSGVRAGQVEAREAAIAEAALLLIEAGDFRPSHAAIMARSGYFKSALHKAFTTVELLMRHVARTQAGRVAAAIRKHAAAPVDGDDKALAWLVLVGKPRD